MSGDIPNDETMLDLDAIEQPQVVLTPPVADVAALGDDQENLIAEEDPEFDSTYVSPIIERVFKPYSELRDLLHITHGDQIRISEIVEGINEGKADSIEMEMFREMIRLKGADVAMQWLASTQNAINHMAYLNGMTDTVMRSDSQWLQGILIDDKVVGAQRPGVESKKNKHVPGERLTGKNAMIRVRQEMQIGDFVTIPLPHTGIWVTLLVAGEDEMVNFHTRVLSSKSVLGRRTAGLAFSNSDVIILRHLWELLANMIMNTSMGNVNKKELINLVKVQDIPLMVAGYMAARFRSGYHIAQACQIDPSKCSHVEVSKVNINRMSIIDNARLTESQRAHMRRRTGHKLETVLAYQEGFTVMNNNVRMLTDTIRIVFGMPSIEQKLNAGDAWIDAIEDAVTLSFTDTMTREERVKYINKQAAVSALRNYAHWVKRIDYLDADGDVYGFIEGDEDIYSQLSELSSKPEIKDKFFLEISKFINEVTIGIVALPRYTCPSCQQKQPAVNDVFPDFTPVNMERCFFTLLGNTLNDSMASADI